MIKYSFKYLIIGWCVLTTELHAQQKPFEELPNKFSAFARQHLQEKLYVHTDRDFYVTGETLWFKIFDVDGSLHHPLSLSSLAYVELLDKNNQAVSQAKIGVKDGYGNGSLFLPASLSSGNYCFRAYTNWMKNFGEDYYFHKTISIVNPFVKLDKPVATSAKIDAGFFPEGGNLIAGVSNKVAFKITEAGRGIDFFGTLINQHNDTITTFAPFKFGIGNFVFTPRVGDAYRVVVKTNDQQLFFDLPMAEANGYAMHLESEGQNIKVLVTHKANKSTYSEPVCLFVHSREITTKADVRFLLNDTTTFLIEEKELSGGISHFTLFSKDLKPVSERLFFKKPDSVVSIKIETDRLQYGPRAKVALTIRANKKTNGSLSVFRMDSLSGSGESHISDYLWLASDLQGTIEMPSYYLSNDPLVKKAQDNLMLTHGWRRFRWDSVLNNRATIQFVPEMTGHIVHAKIFDENGMPADHAIGYAAVPGKVIRLYNALSNKKGEVFFEMKNFFGEQQLIAQTNTKLDSTKRIEVINPFSTEYPLIPLPNFQVSPGLEKDIVSRSVAMQTQDIYLGKESERFLKLPSDTIPFYGAADETYLLDQYTRFPVMEEVMREYVPGVMVRKRKDGFHFIVLDKPNHSVFRETPLVLLDGVPIFDEDEIMNFDPLKVKKLEVVTSKYFLGPNIFPGVVSYSSYKGDLGGFQLNPKAVIINYEGLQRQREFYSPDHEKLADNRLPDFRSLLYWNPAMEIDSSGKCELQFSTSDLPGNYLVVIEGLTDSGLSGGSVYNFSVIK